jgi:hypothetical protein
LRFFLLQRGSTLSTKLRNLDSNQWLERACP